MGPVGTFAINSDIAIDGYYNLRPTLLISGSTADSYTYGSLGFGATHALVATFRWKALSVGLEYVAGKVNSAVAEEIDGTTNDLDDAKVIANNFRLVIGAKF